MIGRAAVGSGTAGTDAEVRPVGGRDADVVIGMLSSRRRSSEIKMGEHVAERFAGNPDETFERAVQFQDQEYRRRD